MKKVMQNKYLVYTVLYWVFIAPLIYYISSIGLCAIGTSDAVAQIYPIMRYTRKVLLNFFDSIINGNKFVFPMVEYTLGMGDDTIAALNWHGFGDPIYILTCFVSEDKLPYLYTILFYFRVYLGGVSFLLFVSEHDNNKSVCAYVIGGLLYSFTGFTMQSNMHTIFTHAMIYTPLMMLGAERCWKGKKKGLLVLSTFLFALSGFFFLYIASVSLAVYVVYRMLHEKVKCKEAIIYIYNMVVEYILGLGMSAFIFIPAVIGFLGSDRTGIKRDYHMFYSVQEIWTMLKNMFLPSYSTEQELAVCTIGIIIVICVFLSKEKKRERINLIMLFILTIIPFVSCVMSGFGECYGRWELIINMYFAYLAVMYWDELNKLSVVQRVGITIVFLGLCFIGKVEGIVDHQKYSRTLRSYAILLLMLVVILPMARRFKKQRITQASMLILFAVSYLTICYNWRVAARDRDISVLQEREVVAELLEGIEDNSFYRTDNERGFSEPRLGMNISLSQGYPGVMEYVSIENNSYIYSFEKWGISSKDHNVMGLDQRAVLETLCSVKYFVVRSEYGFLAPYGFEYVKSTEDGEWNLYQNRYALPVLYGYNKVVSSDMFTQMNGLEKQDCMLDAAAVENYDGDTAPIEFKNDNIHETDYRIENIKNGTIKDGIITLEAGAQITIYTKRYVGKENYLCFENSNNDNVELVVEVKEGYTKYRKPNANRFVTLGTVEKDTDTEVIITFSQDIQFKQEELKILTYDFSDYVKKISKLQICDNAPVVRTNYIQGNIKVSEKSIVCAAIPFSKGWNAYVDGEKVNTYRVNDLFVGIEVSEGTHNVELKYVTPGIKIGVGISGICIFIIAIFFSKGLIKRYSN